MHLKKMLVLIAIFTTFFIPCYHVSSSTLSSFTVLYTISGTYDLPSGQTQVIDQDINVTYDDSGASINFYSNSLPYEINASIFFLTPAERQAGHLIPDASVVLTGENENDPFKVWFGCYMYDATITNENYTATFKWHSTLGILLCAEITKTHEMQTILRITYKQSSIDIYGGFDPNYLQKIQLYKFLLSPAGLITLAIPFFAIVILICYIVGTRKKLKSSSRKGRILTG